MTINAYELIQQINLMRKNSTYLSNAYFTKPQLDLLLEKQNVRIIEGESLILLLIEEKSFARLYFYSENLLNLKNIRSMLKYINKPIIADIIGKMPQVEDLAIRLTDYDFEVYSVFTRMICDEPNNLYTKQALDVKLAVNEDVDEIIELLHSEFDPLNAHIPPKDEIICAVSRKQISLVRKHSKLAGFAYFEDKSPYNSILRYLLVNKEFREQGIGKGLLSNKFAQHGSEMKYMLWVGTDNKAQKLYKSFNFKQDGMMDYILKLQGEL